MITDLIGYFLENYTSDALREFVLLCGGPKNITIKQDRAEFIARTLTSATEVRRLWQQMDTLSRKALTAAYHNDGVFNADAFIAQYGSLPPRSKKYEWSWYTNPILLDLFLLQGVIPEKIMPILAEIVPPPERFQLTGTVAEPPPLIIDKQPIECITALREDAGRHDLLLFLGLLAKGELKLSSSSLRLTPKSVAVLMKGLQRGDFNPLAEKADETITCFGLTTFAYQAGLISPTGQLLDPGKQYLATESPELLLAAVEQWSNAKGFDELTRLKALRGLRAHGIRLTPPGERRNKIIEALSWCPINVWIAVSDFYRAVKIWGFDFDLEQGGLDRLYVGQGGAYYQDSNWAPAQSQWLLTKGLYINVVLWETLASIGAIDIIYTDTEDEAILPAETYYYDELRYSAYDGLVYFRINPLGAYLFGQTSAYTSAQGKEEPLFELSPAGHVTLLRPQALSTAQQIQLEQIADVTSDGYQLSPQKLLAVLEVAPDLDPQRAFLMQRHRGPLPDAVVAMLGQIEADSTALSIQANAFTIRARSADVAQAVMSDPVASKIARRLDDRTLLIHANKETAFRNALRRLGYGLQK